MRSLREEASIKEIIDSDNSLFLVIEVKNRVIGFACLYLKETGKISCLKKQRFLYIQDFVIDIAMRNKGYGTKLMEGVKKIAKDKSVDFIRLSVFPDNLKAISFYEKMGLCKKMITMECVGSILMEQIEK